MPKRIAVNTLVLSRDGKRITVKPGTLVDLTSEEIEQLKPMGAIRQPVNESPAAEPKKEEVKEPAKPAAAASAKPATSTTAKKDEDL